MYITAWLEPLAMEIYLPTHSVWLVFMTEPVGQEQFDRVGLAALIRQREVQFLLLHGFATGNRNNRIFVF